MNPDNLLAGKDARIKELEAEKAQLKIRADSVTDAERSEQARLINERDAAEAQLVEARTLLASASFLGYIDARGDAKEKGEQCEDEIHAAIEAFGKKTAADYAGKVVVPEVELERLYDLQFKYLLVECPTDCSVRSIAVPAAELEALRKDRELALTALLHARRNMPHPDQLVDEAIDAMAKKAAASPQP